MTNFMACLFIAGASLIYLRIFGYFKNLKYKNLLLVAGIVLCLAGTLFLFATSPSGSHRCAICGSTKNLR